MHILHDVETSDLEPGDVVIHYGDQTGYAFVSMSPLSEAADGYAMLTWEEQVGNGHRFSTTAQPHNTWPTVVRNY